MTPFRSTNGSMPSHHDRASVVAATSAAGWWSQHGRVVCRRVRRTPGPANAAIRPIVVGRTAGLAALLVVSPHLSRGAEALTESDEHSSCILIVSRRDMSGWSAPGERESEHCGEGQRRRAIAER